MGAAADHYTACVDAVLEQRTRLRGPEPPDDPFAGLLPDHPILKSDPRRPMEPNLAIIASYVRPDDIVVDVGGGGGRYGLPLAPLCREVINVDPSATMLAASQANAQRAGITNARTVHASWPMPDPPRGTVALVSHVAYLTRDILAFIRGVEAAASRLVMMTVGCPPPPARIPEAHAVIFGEVSAAVPGLPELVNVLWELDIEPDIRMLPDPSSPRTAPVPTREAGINVALAQLRINQWAHWDLPPDVQAHVRQTLEARFDELFRPVEGGFQAVWTEPRRDALITWAPRR